MSKPKAIIGFVYRLQLKRSCLFYIGIAKDADARRIAHLANVLNCIIAMQRGVADTAARRLPAHKRIAEEIFKRDIYKKHTFLSVSNAICFEVLEVTDTIQAAISAESDLIKNNGKRKGLLNVNTHSTHPLNKAKR